MSDVSTKFENAVKIKTGRSVIFFLQSQYLTLQARWQWELHTDSIFCSDVIATGASPGPPLTLVHPDDLPQLAGLLADIREGRSPELSFRVITSYGSVAHIAARQPYVLKTLAAEEQPDPALVTYQEWAGRKAAEERSDAVQSRLLAYEQNESATGTGHWYYNMSTSAVWYSDGYFRLYNLPPQALNPHLHTFYSFLHPEDREAVLEARTSAITRHLPLQLEYRVVCRDLAVKHVRESNHWTFNKKGELLMVGSLADISDACALEQQQVLTENELLLERQKLKKAEEASLFGTFEINLHTRHARFSDTLYRLMGLKPGARPPGMQTMLDCIHPDDRELFQKTIQADYAAENVTEITMRLVSPDHKVRVVRRRGRVVTNHLGQPIAIGTCQDITRQTALERELQKLKEEAALLLATRTAIEETAYSAIWMVNKSNGNWRGTENLYHLLGMKPRSGELSFQFFLQNVLPEDLKTVENCFGMLETQTEKSHCQFRMVVRNEVRHLKAFIQPLPSGDGHWMTAVLQDVTETEQYQRLHTGSKQFTQTLIDSLPDYVLATDMNNNITHWNLRFEKEFGLKKEKVVGKNLLEVLPALAGDELVAALNQVIQNKIVHWNEVHLPGTRNIVNISLVPVQGAPGQFSGILHVLHDVTREAALREQLIHRMHFTESLLELSADRIIVLDRNMNYQYWNKRAEEHYGIAKEEVIGRNILELFPSFAGDPSYQEFRKVLRGETIHIPARNTGNSETYCENYLVPIRNEGAEVTGILWIVHHLADEYVRRQLENKNAEITNFAFIASHDLKEPIRKIYTFTDWLIEKEGSGLTPRGKEYAGKILSAVRRLDGLIEDITVLMKLQASGELAPVDLNAVLAETRLALGDTIEASGAVISSEELPVIAGNSKQLVHLFSNLISNAIKFQEDGATPVVNIHCARVAQAPGLSPGLHC